MLDASPLICPIDGQSLHLDGQRLCCPSNHSFDIARQGYANLLPVHKKHSRDPGDSKNMVEARQRFLDSGIYNGISDQLNTLVQSVCGAYNNLTVLDAGCGEGFYLDRLAKTVSNGQTSLKAYGLDISKWAVQAACRRNKQISWLVASNAAIPFQPHTFDLIVCAFGYHKLEWFNHLLKPNGHILLVDAGPEHLLELREVIYPEVRKSELSPFDHSGFTLLEHRLQIKDLTLNKQQLSDLLLMTPHLYRASHEGKEKAANLESLNVQIDVQFRLLSKMH
ncbi:hypothetical protein WH50_10310 [Pokkaliibacter plantistimulans]|uniref:Methyltransferase domain-containing protein n=1 Tax=Pokkaliibacter plantistimulans TaxID=1635171 RepID=A0ABX5M0Q9_9GAMM|nr:methyltransferase domain-containing protein [Pokkaliibacter plantistimulans]PXF31313.1 hypothetical protein WH50_10310 [Pokkaliibacter plantistimulans]